MPTRDLPSKEYDSKIYENAKIEVNLERERRKIKVNRGIRQGDVMSDKTFIKSLEEPYKKLERNGTEINANDKRLNLLVCG